MRAKLRPVCVPTRRIRQEVIEFELAGDLGNLVDISVFKTDPFGSQKGQTVDGVQADCVPVAGRGGDAVWSIDYDGFSFASICAFRLFREKPSASASAMVFKRSE